MNQPDPAVTESPVQESRRLRFELIFASGWLAIGLFAMPAVIYFVGASLLGPYGENAGLGRFYADFFGDLAEPAVRAWCIALGPLVLVSVIRAIFIGVAPRAAAAHNAHPPTEHARLEPRIGPE
jgi:hypothetical protein